MRAIAVIAAAAGASAQNQNITCIIVNCLDTFDACTQDPSCNSTFNCVQGCGLTNQQCVYQCELSPPADAQFDTMMQCLTGNGCITDVPSYPCSKPDKPLSPFGLADVSGSWWIVKGRSKAFDCFDCQHLQWYQDNATAGSGWVYDAHFEVNSTTGLYAELKVPNVTNPEPGVFHLQYSEHGLSHDEWWYATAGEETFGPDYRFLEYCGTTAVMNYAGGFMLSRAKQPLPSDVEAKLQQVAAAQGLEWAGFCPVVVDGCKE